MVPNARALPLHSTPPFPQTSVKHMSLTLKHTLTSFSVTRSATAGRQVPPLSRQSNQSPTATSSSRHAGPAGASDSAAATHTDRQSAAANDATTRTQAVSGTASASHCGVGGGYQRSSTTWRLRFKTGNAATPRHLGQSCQRRCRQVGSTEKATCHPPSVQWQASP